jgi:hypothetical protein
MTLAEEGGGNNPFRARVRVRVRARKSSNLAMKLSGTFLIRFQP